MPQVTVAQSDPRHPAAIDLLKASHALMQSLFAAEDNHYLEISELCAEHIRFFTAQVNGEILGCIALANKGTYGEVKSMFVSPNARGLGVGAALMDAFETDARQQSLPSIKLETGDALTSAQRLYQRHGFSICAPFGDYVENPTSVFMSKDL